MRIDMISEHASPLAKLGGENAGGQNVHVKALAVTLGRAGLEVVIHTRRDDESLPDKIKIAPNVTVNHIEAGPPVHIDRDELLPYMAQFAQALLKHWNNDAPDLVHAHYWMSGHAALMAASQVQVPVIQTFHELDCVKKRFNAANTNPPERSRMEEAIIRDVDWIIATCSDEIVELTKLDPELERVNVIPCGVDVQFFKPTGESDPRIPGIRRIVMLGRLIESKGFEDAIRALEKIPNAELIIGGGPPKEKIDQHTYARKLLNLAKELGVRDRVQLRGQTHRRDVPKLLRSADIVLCTPWYEPFGIVPLEAMACCKPVVASAVGGQLDSVVDGITGFHVESRNTDQIATAVNRLLDDESLARRFGGNGWERIQSRYTWSLIAAQTFSVYRRVIAINSQAKVALI